MVEGKRVHVQANVACRIDYHNSVLDTIWYGSILLFAQEIIIRPTTWRSY